MPEAKAAKSAHQKAYNQTPKRKETKTARQRKRRGMPDPTRPRPERCEAPGCTRKATDLDHCHATRQFRGWLCNNCNLDLARFGDDLMGLELVRQFYTPQLSGLGWSIAGCSADKVERIYPLLRAYLLKYSAFNWLWQEEAEELEASSK
jgi:Recombination endonuclease VII